MSTFETQRQRIINFVRARQTTLASGLAALLIIVVGFLIFNFFLSVNKDNAPQENATLQESTESAQQITETPTPTPTPVQIAQNDTDKNGQVSQDGSASVTLPQEYTVVRGDTLGTIAKKFYNDSSKWVEISKANKLTNPNRIHVGNKLTIPKVETGTTVAQKPSLSNVKEIPATGVRTSGGGNVEYVVSRGDTLWQIAQDYYGSGLEWYRIKNANPNIGTLINGRPRIEPGQHIIIP